MATIDYMILADAATAAENKLYIHGAGWDSILAATFPVEQPLMSVALRVRIPWAETNQPHEIELDVLDQDGVSIMPPDRVIKGQLNAGRPAGLPQGEDQVFPFVINLAGLKFEKPGNYVIVFRLDGLKAAESRFRMAAMSLNVKVGMARPNPPT